MSPLVTAQGVISLGRFFFLRKSHNTKTLKDLQPPFVIVDDLNQYGLGKQSYPTKIQSVRVITPRIDVTFQNFFRISGYDPVSVALSECDIYELSLVEDFKTWSLSVESQIFLFVKGVSGMQVLIYSSKEDENIVRGTIKHVSSRIIWKASDTPIFLLPSQIIYNKAPE